MLLSPLRGRVSLVGGFGLQTAPFTTSMPEVLRDGGERQVQDKSRGRDGNDEHLREQEVLGDNLPNHDFTLSKGDMKSKCLHILG